MQQTREAAWTRRAALAGLAAAAMPRPGRAAGKPFRIAVSAPVVSVLPIYLAADSGFFGKQGLDASIISTEGGVRGVQVLLSGEIQAMHVGLSPIVAANAQGADVRAVAATTNTLPITIFATKATTPKLPKGTVVGISVLGSETDVALSVALDALGMKRDDLEITQIGGTAQRLAAMIAGRIGAAPLLEPSTTAARQRGFSVVYDLSANNTPWIFDAVAMTTGFLQQNGGDVQAFLRAYVESAYWALANPDEGKKVIASRFRLKDQAVIDASYAEFARLMPRDARPSVEGARNVIKYAGLNGVALTSQDPASYLDFRPLDTLAASGFFEQMRQKYHVQ